MGSSDRRKKSNARKRKFQGNQHHETVVLTANNPTTDGEQPPTSNVDIASTAAGDNDNSILAPPDTLSASAKKLKIDFNLKQQVVEKSNEIAGECYVFFNTFILQNLVEDIGNTGIQLRVIL